MHKKKILLIVSKFTDSSRSLCANLQHISQDKWDIDFCTYRHLYIEISNAEGKDIFEVSYNGTDLKDYDYIYVRNWINQDQEIAAIIANYCHLNGVPFDDEQLIHERHDGKLFQMCLLAINGIKVPHTIFMSSEDLHTKYHELSSKLGEKFIMKNSKLNRGKQNYLIDSKEKFLSVIEDIEISDTFAFQNFIENDFEYRYLVFGGRTHLVMRRTGPENSHKNNANGLKVKYMTDEGEWEYKELAEKIAVLMRRDVLGVDILIDSANGDYYVLEANPAPGMKVKTEKSKIKLIKFVEYINSQMKS